MPSLPAAARMHRERHGSQVWPVTRLCTALLQVFLLAVALPLLALRRLEVGARSLFLAHCAQPEGCEELRA